MATAEELAELRRMIDEPGQDPYTDEMLGARIDASSDLRSLASDIWLEKSARYASMVDVREGNSDRKLSQLHAQASKMAASYAGSVTADESLRVSRTRKIERQ